MTHTQNYGHGIQCPLSVIHIRRIACNTVILRMYIEDDTYAELRTRSMDTMHVDTMLNRHLGS